MFPVNNTLGYVPRVPNYKGPKTNAELTYIDYFASKGRLYADIKPQGLGPAVSVGYALANNLIEDIGKNIILVARGDATCSALRVANLYPNLIKGVILAVPMTPNGGVYYDDDRNCMTTHVDVPVLVFYPKDNYANRRGFPSQLNLLFSHKTMVLFERARQDGQPSFWDGYLDIFHRDLFHEKVSEWLANGMSSS